MSVIDKLKIPVYIQSYTPSVLWKIRSRIMRTLQHPKKIKNFAAYQLSVRRKETHVRNYPVICTIEPSAGCNLKCPMCARNYRPNNIAGNMKFDSFVKLMDDIGSHLMFLLLFGYGEPLLNPDVFKFVREAKGRGIFTVMGTNASLLTPEKAQEMIDSGLDMILIALDSIEKEAYEKYRVGSNFEQVVENIKYLTKTKESLGKVNPIVDVQFLAFKENVEHIEKLKSFANELGADKHSIRKVVSYSEYDPEWEKVRNFLPEDDSGYVHSLYQQSDSAPQMKSFCNYAWRHATINWNGDIVACCKDIDSRHVFGNAFEGDSFIKIWNDKKIVGFRSAIKKNIESIDICKRCNRRAVENPFLSS